MNRFFDFCNGLSYGINAVFWGILALVALVPAVFGFTAVAFGVSDDPLRATMSTGTLLVAAMFALLAYDPYKAVKQLAKKRLPERLPLKTLWLVSFLAEIVAWPATVIVPFVVMFYVATNFKLGCTAFCEEGEWNHFDGSMTVLFVTGVGMVLVLWLIHMVRESLGDYLRRVEAEARS